MQVLIPLAPPVPWIAMSFLIATQVVGDGALTVYLVNETTLRQRLLPAAALGRAAATWQVANGLLTPIGALIGGAFAESDRDATDAMVARHRLCSGLHLACRRTRGSARTCITARGA